uniref:Uncharacterized protein n=1 Tax=Aegilops tauschii TaxID=37682 RepID=M8AQR0_AEGTA
MAARVDAGGRGEELVRAGTGNGAEAGGSGDSAGAAATSGSDLQDSRDQLHPCFCFCPVNQSKMASKKHLAGRGGDVRQQGEPKMSGASLVNHIAYNDFMIEVSHMSYGISILKSVLDDTYALCMAVSSSFSEIRPLQVRWLGCQEWGGSPEYTVKRIVMLGSYTSFDDLSIHGTFSGIQYIEYFSCVKEVKCEPSVSFDYSKSEMNSMRRKRLN